MTVEMAMEINTHFRYMYFGGKLLAISDGFNSRAERERSYKDDP